ncbi:hypothetical protein H9P43_008095 [Blastocladiella emersonii ATCC 22665]|nr:hypothetical protein H9P43_008095 [Blastocladiella emersonii ATCC 22665]
MDSTSSSNGNPVDSGATAKPASFRQRIAHDHPQLVPLKVCQERAMIEGYKSMGLATVGTFLIAKLARVQPNNVILASAGAGVVCGFGAAALYFSACTASLAHEPLPPAAPAASGPQETA